MRVLFNYALASRAGLVFSFFFLYKRSAFVLTFKNTLIVYFKLEFSLLRY